MLMQDTILAKEEINLAYYVVNQTNNLKNLNYLKNLKDERFWKEFREQKIWRKRKVNFTSSQLFRIYYNKIVIPKITKVELQEMVKVIKNTHPKRGYFFINRYNSKYPFKYEGLFLLQPSRFRKSISNLNTTPLYCIKYDTMEESDRTD